MSAIEGNRQSPLQAASEDIDTPDLSTSTTHTHFRLPLQHALQHLIADPEFVCTSAAIQETIADDSGSKHEFLAPEYNTIPDLERSQLQLEQTARRLWLFSLQDIEQMTVQTGEERTIFDGVPAEKAGRLALVQKDSDTLLLSLSIGSTVRLSEHVVSENELLSVLKKEFQK